VRVLRRGRNVKTRLPSYYQSHQVARVAAAPALVRVGVAGVVARALRLGRWLVFLLMKARGRKRM
jgi:hypothetical protein